jgi:hypothetical protein
MKKSILTCLIVCLIAAHSFAQTSFAKGDNVVGFGIGVGGNLYSGYHYSNIKRIPAITASYEHCIVGSLWDNKSSLGVGGIVGYTSAKWDDKSKEWGWKVSHTIIGARCALHYSFLPQLDTYFGLTVGFDAVSWTWTGKYDKSGGYSRGGSSGFAWSSYLGARYYFTDAVGAFAEIGYGFSALNLGVALKF